MYSLDGVALANPTYGWSFKRDSEPWVSRGLDRPDFNASNRDGTIAVRGHVTTPAVTLVVRAPDSTVEGLRRLLRLGTSLTKTSDPTIALNVQIVTLTHETIRVAGGGQHQLTAVYRIAPHVWWRDVATTDYSIALPQAGAGAANANVCTATTGAVHDALITVSGEVTNPRIAGKNGTWVEWEGTVWDGQWLRIDTATGRAWFGTSLDKWGDTSQEVTSQINSGAYPYFLELFPTSTGSAGCAITLSWDTVGPKGGLVVVRACNAYDR